MLRALLTYKYLRVVVPFPAMMILLGSLVEFFVTDHHWRQSISSYYEGPVRDLFVGALIATAVCLIAYKGESKFEDMTLNFAGFNALFVALMPSNFEQALTEPDAARRAGLTSDQLMQFTRLILALLLLVALIFVFLDRRLFSPEGFDWDSQPGLAKVLIVASAVAEIVLLVEVLAFIVTGSTVVLGIGWIHNFAAIFLIMNLSFAIASHGWPARLKAITADPANGQAPQPAPGESDRAVAFYQWFVGVMWLVLALGGAMIVRDFVLQIETGHWVIVEEYLGIGFFVVFWFFASRDVWRSVTLTA